MANKRYIHMTALLTVSLFVMMLLCSPVLNIVLSENADIDDGAPTTDYVNQKASMEAPSETHEAYICKAPSDAFAENGEKLQKADSAICGAEAMANADDTRYARGLYGDEYDVYAFRIICKTVIRC